MKKKIILLIIFFLGLTILLYPFISQYWNSLVQSKAITDYDKIFSKLTDNDYNDIFKEANIYNQELYKLQFPLTQYKEISNYSNLLNINNNGMMGYITVPKLKIELPIYHGTSASVLNIAVGHLEGSSLPIGGDSTHSILSAHRGLPSAKLFTNLNKLELGDIFTITIVDRKLTYQVDNIITVEPTDISNLGIIEGEDYVTLVTCTPYGINTHRLLVRGTRISNIEENVKTIGADAKKQDKLIVSLLLSIPILLILAIWTLIKPVRRKYKNEINLSNYHLD